MTDPHQPDRRAFVSSSEIGRVESGFFDASWTARSSLPYARATSARLAIFSFVRASRTSGVIWPFSTPAVRLRHADRSPSWLSTSFDSSGFIRSCHGEKTGSSGTARRSR